VIVWLEKEGLGGELGSLFKEQNLDGSVLFALYSETKKEVNSFKQDCTDLGITAVPMQLKLKGRLTALFG
jgi:hypothetical protein